MSTEHTAPRWNIAHLGLLAGIGGLVSLGHQAGWSLQAIAWAATGFTLAWLGWAEWRRPHRADWVPGRSDLRRDGLYFLINAGADALAKLLLRLLAAGLAAWHAGLDGVRELPLPLAVALAVVVGEFGAYWLHRISHQGGWLWRVHALHHAPQQVNLTNNLTVHPINVILIDLVRVTPLVLLGFSAEAIVLAGVFGQAQSFATHANTPGTMGWLNYLIGTAELHRRHHADQVEDALNFGTAVPLWDQLFGTFRYRGTDEPRHVGLAEPARYPETRQVAAWLSLPVCRCHDRLRNAREGGAAG